MICRGLFTKVINWTTVDGAEGYDVFFAKVADAYECVQSTNTLNYKIMGLKKNTHYKAYVVARRNVGGVKTYLGESPNVYAVTNGGKKWTNAKKVTVKKKKFTLAVGRSAKIKAGVKPVKSGKKLVKHVSKLRYYSGDPSVATVNASGTVTAVRPGVSWIYVLANNGVYKGVKVTVVDQPTKIKFKRKSYVVKVGKQSNLSKQVWLLPVGVNPTLTWESSNPELATVDASGLLQGLKKGSVIITATTANGKKASVKVRIMQ